MPNHSYLSWLVIVPLITNCFGQSTIIRGPYLQLATTESIIIRWKTSAPTDSQVKIGFAPGKYFSTFSESTLTTEHIVEARLPQPGRRYFYTVGTTTAILQGDKTNTFLSYPANGNSRKLRFWITGDGGNNSDNQRAVRDQYLHYATQKNTDGWLLLGDNAYNNGTEPEYQANFFSQYQDSILKQVVLWPAVGNHDYANSDALQKSKDIPYYKLFTLPTNGEAGGVPSETESYYSYNVGNIHFIALDSYGKENEQRIYDTLSHQITWLKKDLEENKQQWTIVYFHHPPYTKGSHDSDVEEELKLIRKNVARILERYEVDLVLCGHSHSYERSKLMKGYFGEANSFNEEAFVIDSSSGLYNGSSGSCPYTKIKGQRGQGIIYVVAGSSGQVGGTVSGFPHPAMFYSNRSLGGSLILEVERNRLDLKWLCADGIMRDSITMMKDVSRTDTIDVSYQTPVTLAASWIGSYQWSTGEKNSSVWLAPDHDQIITARDLTQCLVDSFKIKVNPVITEIHKNERNEDVFFSIYPQPANRIATIDFNGHCPTEIELFTETGSLIFQKKFSNNNGQSIFHITVEETGWHRGTYFLSVSDGKKKQIRKIVVQ